jgi:hypothetical protein
MGPFQIAFVAINLMLPAWLYFRSDSMGVKWDAFDKTMARLIDASGGANCDTDDIVDKVNEICLKSGRKSTKNDTVVLERDIGAMTYSCEWRRESIAVKLTHAVEADRKPECVLKDPFSVYNSQPGFVFTPKGFVNSISFDSSSGERQVIPVSNCRRKLKALKGNYPTMESLEAAMPDAPNDPPDRKTANRMCWVFDAAPGWAAFRRRYLGKSESGSASASE